MPTKCNKPRKQELIESYEYYVTKKLTRFHASSIPQYELITAIPSNSTVYVTDKKKFGYTTSFIKDGNLYPGVLYRSPYEKGRFIYNGRATIAASPFLVAEVEIGLIHK